MNKKVFNVICIILLTISITACTSRADLIESQRQKESDVIKKQQKKEQAILEIKEDQRQKQADLLNSCFNNANEKAAKSASVWSNYQEVTCVKYRQNLNLYNRCLDQVSEGLEEAKEQRNYDREECLKIYPQN